MKMKCFHYPQSFTLITDKVHKNLELYQTLMYNFLYQTALELIHFGLEVSTHLGMGLLAHFGPKNQKRKTDKIHKDFGTVSSFYVPKCPDTPILYTTDAH